LDRLGTLHRNRKTKAVEQSTTALHTKRQTSKTKAEET
jgi:hypothetical protein